MKTKSSLRPCLSKSNNFSIVSLFLIFSFIFLTMGSEVVVAEPEIDLSDDDCCSSSESIEVRSCEGDRLKIETKTPECSENSCVYKITSTNYFVCTNGCFQDSSTAYCLSDPTKTDTTKTGCLICERGVCIDNPRKDEEGIECSSGNNECPEVGSTCGNPCLVCKDSNCIPNPESHICNSLQNQCNEKGEPCLTPGINTIPKTLTIDIARLVRTTVSFAEIGSMAGTWLDKTLGTSFFSSPLWGKLEKTWPTGAKIFGGNWESSICRDLWCIIPDDSGISTVGSAIGSHIEGQKLKISPELNLYKITFALNPTTESLTEQMNFTIELYDNSGNKEYIDVNNDKKPDTWINIKSKYATAKTNPIAFYSRKDYQRVCLKFFNVEDYVDELRLLLLSNSNQICSKFFEGGPGDATQEIQTGEIQFGGDVDECANC